MNIFFGRVFLDFWKILYQYFILNTPEIFFWYVQGAEVEFIRRNSTSAPCIYEKTTQIGEKIGYFKKSMKKFSKKIFQKKKFKEISKKNFFFF